MNNFFIEQKPKFLYRLLLLIILVYFFSIENNPLVKFEAVFGLSPSPIERFFGLKSLFSGMTEGVYQFVRFNYDLSIKANIFSPLVLPIIIYILLSWKFPKINSRKKEIMFFSTFIFLSIIVNLIN